MGRHHPQTNSAHTEWGASKSPQKHPCLLLIDVVVHDSPSILKHAVESGRNQRGRRVRSQLRPFRRNVLIGSFLTYPLGKQGITLNQHFSSEFSELHWDWRAVSFPHQEEARTGHAEVLEAHAGHPWK